MNPLWKEKVVTLWPWGMGLEHIEFQWCRFLPIRRFRPTGSSAWTRWRWEWDPVGWREENES